MNRLLLRLPLHVWLAAAVAAALRALPFLWTRVVEDPPGLVAPPIGYIPKDWLAYVSLIRQLPEAGQWALANPFTTEPQSGRFILFFHQLLNAVHRLTEVDPFWLLELSRVPLILAFFAVLWRFLGDVLPGGRERSWALWLIAFSGGVDFLVLRLAGWAPTWLENTLRQELWSLYGWSTFAGLYNPLWVAGLTLLLVVLRPVLRPGGPTGRAELLTAGLGLFALCFVHPYSAIAAVSIVIVTALLRAWLDGGIPRAELGRTALAVVPALLLAGAVSAWQLQDPVFRGSSGGTLGSQASAVFWYPLTLGAVGLFALRGWRRWLEQRHAWRFALGGWTVAVALLHSSPVLNGYHFVMFLHLPVCVVAATAVAEWQERLAGARRRVVRLVAVGAVLFASAAGVTVASVEDLSASLIPAEWERILRALSALPPGRVLSPPDLGNYVPAWGSHRVYVGHWFMTPDYGGRAELATQLLRAQGDRAATGLRDLVDRQRIDYLVVPMGSASRVAQLFPGRVAGFTPFGSMGLLRLEPRPSEGAP